MKTSVTVSVAVDPRTAFVAFTDEIDLWYVRGPINYFDHSRAIGLRCESGVGGRIVEVYDAATGDGLELGRITVWEPGQRLSWTSSVDDVAIDVFFRAAAGATEVTVVATIADSARRGGGDAWVRVVPQWFPAWCRRRETAVGPQPALGRLAVGLAYTRPGEAAHWLADVFGLDPVTVLPEREATDRPEWIEFRVGTCSVILYPTDVAPADPIPTTVTWVYVDDLDAHVARARSGGARIVHDIAQHGYRSYTADDLEGHRWTFVQAAPAVR